VGIRYSSDDDNVDLKPTHAGADGKYLSEKAGGKLEMKPRIDPSPNTVQRQLKHFDIGGTSKTLAHVSRFLGHKKDRIPAPIVKGTG
jgi:hypothetical protein